MARHIDQHKIDETIQFHGHNCPGLAIGIRAAEIVLSEFRDAAEQDLVCVTETDMCGVDAIQYLTGCTYGKGNLIHHDYGKMAFSFYDRKNGKGLRLIFRDEARGDDHGKLTELMARNMKGELTNDEQKQLQTLRNALEQRVLQLPAEQLFRIQPLYDQPPRPARVLESLVCEACGENTMESRTRRFAGKTLCIPCFKGVEQKV